MLLFALYYTSLAASVPGIHIMGCCMQVWTIGSVLHRLLAASYKLCFMHTSCEQSYKGLLSAKSAHMMQLHGRLVFFCSSSARSKWWLEFNVGQKVAESLYRRSTLRIKWSPFSSPITGVANNQHIMPTLVHLGTVHWKHIQPLVEVLCC